MMGGAGPATRAATVGPTSVGIVTGHYPAGIAGFRSDLSRVTSSRSCQRWSRDDTYQLVSLMADDNRKLACSAEVLALVPESLAREYCLFPLKNEWSGLTVAVAEPLSVENLDSVEFVLGREVHQIKCPAEAIRRALDEHYGEERFEDSDLSAYYWREWRNVLDDGTIIIKTSWYDNRSHMTGWTEISADHLDFGLWTWIIAGGKRFKEIISGDDLEVIRQEYNRSRPEKNVTGEV